MSDGYYLSKLTFIKLNADSDTGFYVCLVLNNAGFNYREIFLSVSDSLVTTGKKVLMFFTNIIYLNIFLTK